MCSSLLLKENFLAGLCLRTEGNRSLGHGWDSVEWTQVSGELGSPSEPLGQLQGEPGLWARADPETQGMVSAD